MKPQEYVKLSQSENARENLGYIVRPEKHEASFRSRVLVAFIVIILFLGATAVVVGLFYPDKVNTVINDYFKSDTSSSKNSTELDSNSDFSVGNNVNTSLAEASYNHTDIIHSSQDDKIHQPNGTSVEDKDEMDLTKTEEKDGDEKTRVTPKSGSDKKPLGNVTDEIQNKPPLLTQETLEEAEKKFATLMIRVEAYLEDLTGIRRPEIIIPIFIFLCFLVSCAFSACCCSLMMKRKENQRRKTLGRMITDLETGDTDPILSDQDD